jgi:hypothetical protein
MNLENLISELLLRHNCVVIPTFGGFVAGQVPAHFDTDKGVILPPRKSLLFNKQLISNDGLLIATYAKHNHLNYDVAEFFIKETVQKWQEKLAKGERVTIENVGFLYLDGEKNIGFEQDRYSNLLLASYGLANVHFIPETDIQFVVNEKTGRVSIDEPIEVKPITPIEPIIEPIIEEIQVEKIEELAPIIELHPKKKAWKYIAAAVLLPIAFYSYWIPAKSDVLQSGLVTFRDFNPASPQQKGNYNPKTIDFSLPIVEQRESIETMSNNLSLEVDVFAFYYQNDIIIPVRIREEIKEELIKETTNKPTGVVPSPKKFVVKPIESETKKEPLLVSSNKHLIVGCFSTVDNANKLVTKLKSKGFDAYIVDEVNGLHRVSALNSSNDSSLLSTTKRLNALQISTWILKK